ncbi:MAG: helix-turn-helix domain-containing protein [Novosphingobium sp.]|jgi:IclR family pca regulon transcriptional regulator|nr:helix-turn-helix domain-containing protein [Novosphingobium sp.]
MSAAPSADDGERGAMPAAKDYSEALARGLRILTIFGEDTPSLTLAEIARLIGLPRATTRRALITLVHLGYMEEDRRRFHLRPRVLDLAAAYLRASPAIAILQPACERLAAAHGETFSVAVLDGRHAAMIAYARPRQLYSDSAGIGLRMPDYCSAVGRVLLSGRPPEQLDAYLGAAPLPALTDQTLTSPEETRARIEAARRDGFAVVSDEVEPGFRSMAVPVRRAGGAIAFALNIGMPSGRMPETTLRERYLDLLRQEAAALERQLL